MKGGTIEHVLTCYYSPQDKHHGTRVYPSESGQQMDGTEVCMGDQGSLMKEQLTDVWTKRLGTTKDATVWPGKPGRSYSPRPEEARKGRGYCSAKRREVWLCVCVHAHAHWGLTKYCNLPLLFLSSLATFTIGQVQTEAQEQGSPLMGHIPITHLRHKLGCRRVKGGSREVDGRY